MGTWSTYEVDKVGRKDMTMDLNQIWFILVGILLGGYVILDRFDLGIGILYLSVAKTDNERSLLLNAIAPVWDDNGAQFLRLFRMYTQPLPQVFIWRLCCFF